MSNSSDLDRIDILWSVKIRATIDTPNGPAMVLATVSFVLGTYSGKITREIIAQNVNARGIHDGDLDEVHCNGGAISLAEATRKLAAHDIQPEEIVEATIEAVLLDDVEIAQGIHGASDEDETEGD